MERILLVEDDAALARGIALALDAHERTVTAAQTAAEARRAVAAERFDLVLWISICRMRAVWSFCATGARTATRRR